MISLEVEVVEPKIITNFNEFKNNVDVYTKKFEIEVVSNNLKDAKDASSSINKLRAEIKEKARGYIKTLEIGEYPEGINFYVKTKEVLIVNWFDSEVVVLNSLNYNIKKKNYGWRRTKGFWKFYWTKLNAKLEYNL